MHAHGPALTPGALPRGARRRYRACGRRRRTAPASRRRRPSSSGCAATSRSWRRCRPCCPCALQCASAVCASAVCASAVCASVCAPLLCAPVCAAEAAEAPSVCAPTAAAVSGSWAEARALRRLHTRGASARTHGLPLKSAWTNASAAWTRQPGPGCATVVCRLAP